LKFELNLNSGDILDPQWQQIYFVLSFQQPAVRAPKLPMDVTARQ